MKTIMNVIALILMLGSAVSAQNVTKKEAVNTTKLAQKNARQMKKEAKQSDSQSGQKEATETLKAAKRAEKQAKKNTP